MLVGLKRKEGKRKKIGLISEESESRESARNLRKMEHQNRVYRNDKQTKNKEQEGKTEH